MTHFLPRAATFQPYEIDNDAPAELAQPQLSCDRLNGGEISGQGPALGRTLVGRAGIDIDQYRRRSLGDLDSAATRKPQAGRQSRSEFRIEVDGPVFGRAMRDLRTRKSAPQLRDDPGIIGDHLFGGGGQPQREGSGEACRRIELPRRFVVRRRRHELLEGGTASPRVNAGGEARALALLCLPAHLHHHSRAFVETQLFPGVPNRQKAGALGADVDEDGVEPRCPAHDSAEMDAAGRRRVAPLDIPLQSRAVFAPGGAPLAGPGGDQQGSGHPGYPRPASNCGASYKGSPTTFEWEPA